MRKREKMKLYIFYYETTRNYKKLQEITRNQKCLRHITRNTMNF